MSVIEYSIENNPAGSDDKVIRNGIVDFNGRIILGTIPKYLKDHDRIFMRKDIS